MDKVRLLCWLFTEHRIHRFSNQLYSKVDLAQCWCGKNVYENIWTSPSTGRYVLVFWR
jgi:hypothetical protein